ncbi:hypothetical protein OS493_036787 [Desmophyllum pertusum]|uniref:Uncharacterized protein n=1 Tax=Desmophyllum pertusum TaxID=174260 RepID=A0A9W9YI26_9CNID|nr:hypothetical protein OS493_036787 [Desmophyllum pertusum]
MAVVNLYYVVVILIGAILFCFPLRISGLIQPPTGVTVRAVDGSDFVIISWNYQPDAKYYRIFFRSLKSMQGNSSSPPDEVGPMSVYCLPDNTTCSYCVSNINRTVSCNTLDSKYQAPLLRSELDFEELVSVTVEACSDIFPDACEHQSEWKNYTIPPGAPSAVRNVRARPLSSKTVEVTWSAPNQTRGTIVLYSVLYNTANSKEMGEVFKHVTKGIITGLTAKTTYKIWVTASTADREGGRSDLTTVETYEDECVSSPCQYNGKCNVDGTSYKCVCSGPWEGISCENPKGFAFDKNKCIDAKGDNKPSLHVNVTLEFCVAKCRESSSCKSFGYGLGYGSRGTLVNSLHLQGLGQCKIQTMDTKHNQLKSCYYDYYEKKAPVSAGSQVSSPNMVLFGTFSLLIFTQKW